MQLYCDQERLAAALKAVLPAVPSRYLGADSGVLLNGADDRLEVAAIDQEIAIRCQVGAQVAKAGGVVLPARTITDLVALFGAERVEMELEEANTLALHCGRTQAHVRGWDAADFPPLPEPGGEGIARVEAKVLRDGIGRVIYAASTDPARLALCGVLMRFTGEQVTLAAADGFRLAECTLPLAEPVTNPFGDAQDRPFDDAQDKPFDLVVPARGMRELVKLAQGEVSIGLDADHRHIVFETGDVTVTGSLAGKFPDYERIIPQEWNVRVAAARSSLLRACRVAKAMQMHGGRDILCIEVVSPDAITVSASSVVAGEGQTRLQAAVERKGSNDGLPVKMALDIGYFADAVKATDGEEASISTTADEGDEGYVVIQPIVVQPEGADGQLGVIMPVQLS